MIGRRSFAWLLALGFSRSATGSVYTYAIDDFSVVRSDSLIFNDPFGDGNPPPSAPNYTNGNTGAYFTRGNFGPEAGNKLTLNSDGAVTLELSPPNAMVVQFAALDTNVDPTSPAGLKSNSTFTVRGVFELVVPSASGSGYGISLTDCPSATDTSTCGDKEIGVSVRRRGDGNVVARFEQFNFVGSFTAVHTDIVLAPAALVHQRIGFDLIKPSTGSNLIQADYFFVDSGVQSGLTLFSTSYDTFDVHDWTRPGFSASAEVSSTDTDGDGFPDAVDNCPYFASSNRTDTNHNGRGDVCECGDQNGDGRVNVADIVAINAAIFTPSLATPLCDTNNDSLCDVRDLIGANGEIFVPKSSTCARQPVPGP